MPDIPKTERGTSDRGLGDTPQTAEAKDQQAIVIAIELFRLSKTSKSGEGPAVLARLDELFKAGKITFAELPAGLSGESNVRTETISMNRNLIADLGNVSVWLVHEAYHLAGLGTKLYIDEEINSREMQARYGQEIMRGITYGGKVYRTWPGDIREFFEKNQIVDWVLLIPAYVNEEGFLTPSWIAEHIWGWGGPANRRPGTKTKYIELLLKKPRLQDIGPGARALFALLETAPVQEARKLITDAGGGDFAAGSERIRARIDPAIGYGDGTLRDRITDWKNRTGIDLGLADTAPKR